MSGWPGSTANLTPPSRWAQPLPQDGGHGTFTAGCVRVTAPAAAVRVVNGPGGPQRKRGGTDAIGAVFESDLADLLRKQLVADEGDEPIPVPDILVVNFAGTTRSGRPPVALAALYDSLIQHLEEVLILAPAGNEGDRRKNWPASFAWVVSVGALGEDGQRAPWSNHGRSVDVYAPGGPAGERLCGRPVHAHLGRPATPAGTVQRDGTVERYVVLDAVGCGPGRGADVEHRAEQPSGLGVPARTWPSARPCRVWVRFSTRARSSTERTWLPRCVGSCAPGPAFLRADPCVVACRPVRCCGRA